MSNNMEEASMMAKTKCALMPELRFPEFRNAGEWEEKQVEDFFLVSSSKRVLQEDWTDCGVPFYRTRELVSLNKNESFRSEIFISEELFSYISQKYGLPVEGDFLVSGVGTLGISYQVQAGDRFYFKDGNVLWFKSKGKLVSSFFKHQFQSDAIQDQIRGQSAISTVGTYTIQNAKKTKLSFPSCIEEQQKIADCLSSIDDLITLEARKIDALKAHKKGLMQQLFPAEGETLPKLRFPEFRDAGEWNSRNLGDIAQFSSGGTPAKNIADYWGGTIPWISASSMYETNINSSELNVTELAIGNGTRIAKKGSLLVLVRGSMLFNRIPIGIATIDVAFNQDVKALDIHEIFSKSFLLFQLISFESRIPINETGIGAGKIETDDLKNLVVFIPSIGEQQKIADCLSSIDDLIALQTKKLDALKAHKKGLMQQLFPSLGEVRE